MRIADIKYPDTANGEGVRVSLWLQGCNRHCKGCHNPETWDFNGGRVFTADDKNSIYRLLDLPWCDGISILGGEPLAQLVELEPLLEDIKEKFPDKTIWLWTGNNFDDVRYLKLFEYVDVVIDGAYIESLKDIRLPYAGSSNQRVINLKNN